MSEQFEAKVWYVAYGSNLAIDRFRCYLRGGCPVGGRRSYDGCRDSRDPSATVSLHVPGGLVFAGESSVWGRSMAFYDRRASGRAACRAYLITAEQFADVAAQEMRRPPGGEFARELVPLLAQVDSLHTLGPGNYETIVRLGVLDGVPLLTVTHDDVDELTPSAPSDEYLSQIATGLREAHDWDPVTIANYLAPAPGIHTFWTTEQIAAVARAAA